MCVFISVLTASMHSLSTVRAVLVQAQSSTRISQVDVSWRCCGRMPPSLVPSPPPSLVGAIPPTSAPILAVPAHAPSSPPRPRRNGREGARDPWNEGPPAGTGPAPARAVATVPRRRPRAAKGYAHSGPPSRPRGRWEPAGAARQAGFLQGSGGITRASFRQGRGGEGAAPTEPSEEGGRSVTTHQGSRGRHHTGGKGVTTTRTVA